MYHNNTKKHIIKFDAYDAELYQTPQLEKNKPMYFNQPLIRNSNGFKHKRVISNEQIPNKN